MKSSGSAREGIRRDRADAERDLAVEPRLDIRGVGRRAARGVADEAIERLIELGLERRLVGEPGELGQELGGGLALVARQVEA